MGWLNRPVVTALTAACLGLFPVFKWHLASAEGSMNFAFGAMEKIGQAGPAISLMAVGGLFVEDTVPMPSAIGYRLFFGAIVSRLVILPLCCVPFWLFLRRWCSFFPDDRAFLLVLCLEGCTPSAYNLVTMCVLQGRSSNKIAATLFYQNLAAMLTLTAWATFIVFVI